MHVVVMQNGGVYMHAHLPISGAALRPSSVVSVLRLLWSGRDCSLVLGQSIGIYPCLPERCQAVL